MQVELVSPERILFSGEADDGACARTIGGGDIAFLTGHAPFIGALDIDPVVIRLADGTDEVVAVHGGFVVGQRQPRDDPLRRRRAPEPDRRRPGPPGGQERAEAALRADADDAEAEAALRRGPRPASRPPTTSRPLKFQCSDGLWPLEH